VGHSVYTPPRQFLDAKIHAWQRMWEDLEIGYLDEDILVLLLEFFARPLTYPASSCSGRIVLLDSEYPWAKEETMVVFKSHKSISVEQLRDMIYKPCSVRLWLSVQGPIYHVHTATIDEAMVILDAAREAGFKHSGIMVMSYGDIILELRTGIRLNIPLKDGDTILVDQSKLDYIVNLSNKLLQEAKERNMRLLDALRKRRPEKLWEPAVHALDRLAQG